MDRVTANQPKPTSRWKDAHANLSRVLISSLMKKFGYRKPDVARELGITPSAVKWNIRMLGLDQPGAIDRYAIGGQFLEARKPAQSASGREAA
jgi:hypothetical protein